MYGLVQLKRLLAHLIKKLDWNNSRQSKYGFQGIKIAHCIYYISRVIHNSEQGSMLVYLNLILLQHLQHLQYRESNIIDLDIFCKYFNALNELYDATNADKPTFILAHDDNIICTYFRNFYVKCLNDSYPKNIRTENRT